MTPDERVAWISDLYRRIAGVTTRFAFTPPVERADIDAFRAALWEALPCALRTTVELAPSGRGVDVEVFDPAGARVYHRLMLLER